MNRRRRQAIGFELRRKAIRAVLGAREDQHLLPVAGADLVRQELPLALAIDRVDDLADAGGRFAVHRDLDLGRPVQQACRELPDVGRERRREQQVLPFSGQRLDDLADVANEAHVEHAISLVEDEKFDRAEIDRALRQVIEKTPGRRDDDVHALANFRDLRIDADAAIDHRRTKRQVLAIVANTVPHLGGEFTRRRQDQGPDATAVDGSMLQAMQHRQRETGCLAGARLGARKDVGAFQNKGNSLLLDRGCHLVTLFFDSTQQFGREAEFIE